jgi:rod shape-determining protein MreC
MFVFLNRFIFIILILLLSWILFFGKSVNYISYLRIKATNLCDPVIINVSKGVDECFNLYTVAKNLLYLYEQNIQLKQQISLLEYQIQNQKSLEIENRQLKKQIHLVNQKDVRYISAKIITNLIGPYNYHATILAGEQDGIKKGQIVINNKGFVGKIIQVNQKTSSVLLVTDINSRVPIITTHFLEKGIISGSNQNNLRLLYLADTKNISIGEIVYATYDENIFPTGIPVASISSITKNSVLATPTVDITKLDYVMVLLNDEE